MSDLFGNEKIPTSKDWYKKIFQALTKDKKYIFIKGQVIPKKNNYQGQMRYTGKSFCCGAEYDRKTKICTECGNPTKSDKTVGPVMLKKKAADYQKESLIHYKNALNKFKNDKKEPGLSVLGVMFIRKDNRRFDFDNSFTMVQDQLVSANLIQDDDANSLITIPMGYVTNKTNQGIIIKHFSTKEYFEFILNGLK